MLPPPNGEIFEFPAQMRVRVIGAARDGFPGQVTAVASTRAEIDPAATILRPSQDGHYLSVVLSVTVISREQLNSLFSALQAVEGVRMVI
jgi:putative lipoic acid-binding regulatory protein